MPLNRFEAGGNTYTFPDTLQDYSDNFGDTVPRTTRLPGLDGGFDELGISPAPGEIGTVRQRFVLVAASRAGMDTLRDNVKKLKGWPKGRLYMRPTNYPTDGERYAVARIDSIQMPKREQMHTDLWQEVTVIWQVSSPIWLASGDLSAAFVEASGEVTNVNGDITPLVSTAPSLAIITIQPGTGQSCENPQVQRIVDSEVVDEVSYTGTLVEDDLLIIDAGAKSVTLNGADAYTSSFDFLHHDWFRLLPGDNAIRVVFENAGDAAHVVWEWRSAWY